MAAADRLSHLSDDILTHILSFAPSREAARATALSRRWRRPLWLRTGAVNVDYRSYNAGSGGVPDRRRLVDDADHAYAYLCSRGHVPKKLSIVLPNDAIVCAAGGTTVDDEAEAEDSGNRVEDPRLEWLNNGGLPRCTLPFAVLRVLELTGYDLKPYSDGPRQLVFPFLEAIRLRHCRTELDTLQNIISAAPRLTDVRLEALRFVDHEYVYKISCEAATVVVIENCWRLHHNLSCGIELNAPRLRQFRYVHFAFLDVYTSLSFEWPPSELEQLHLEVHSASWVAASMRRRILTNVRHLKYLKLKAYSIADLANDFGQDFPNLECLEVEELCGWCIQNHGAAATAVVNLLRKCPIVRDLRLKFSWRKYLQEINVDPADEMAAVADFLPCRSIAADDEDDEGVCCDGFEDLHEQLCCRCRLGCLRRVVVEFDAEELSCFQVRLVKFLAKSAVALEELVVDGGKGYDSSCIDRKVARWRKPPRPPRSQSPAPPPPLWPPPLSEFPPLESLSSTSDEKVGEDEVKEDISLGQYVHTSEEEEEDDDDDISPRLYMHSGRKKKKGGCLECFGVTPKAKGIITSRWRRAGAIPRRRHQHHHLGWAEGEDATAASPLVAASVPPSVSKPETPADTWMAPLLSEFPLLRHAPPPASRCPLPSNAATPRRPPSPPEPPSVDLATPPAPLFSTSYSLSGEWRAVRTADLDVGGAASRRRSHHLRKRQRAPPAGSHRRLGTFPGRPSGSSWRR
ncbi:unnamed protein product [Alopecurus aequalis]